MFSGDIINSVNIFIFFEFIKFLFSAFGSHLNEADAIFFISSFNCFNFSWFNFGVISLILLDIVGVSDLFISEIILSIFALFWEISEFISLNLNTSRLLFIKYTLYPLLILYDDNE